MGVSRFVAQTKVVVLLKMCLVSRTMLAKTLGSVVGNMTFPTAPYLERLRDVLVLCRSRGMLCNELLTPSAKSGRPKNANVKVLVRTEKFTPNPTMKNRQLNKLIMTEGSESKTLTAASRIRAN